MGPGEEIDHREAEFEPGGADVEIGAGKRPEPAPLPHRKWSSTVACPPRTLRNCAEPPPVPYALGHAPFTGCAEELWEVVSFTTPIQDA